MKRRRIEKAPPAKNGYSSSPDELGAVAGDYDKVYIRRASTNSRRNSVDARRRSYTDSASQDSPDELDHTVHTFYRNNRNSNRNSNSTRNSLNRGPTASPLTPSPQPSLPRSPQLPLQLSPKLSPQLSPKLSPQLSPKLSPQDTPDRYLDESPQAVAQSPTPPPREPTPAPVPTPAPKKYNLYKQISVLKGHRRGVASVKFSPDGKHIASCSADATIRVWDTFTGKLIHTLEGHLAGISTIAWSPDSKTLASGSDDKSIRLWDTSTGKQHHIPLLGHHNYIYSLAFSPKGNMLVSGSYDEAVYIWDVRTGRVLKSLPAHSDPVGGVDFIRDGTLIASCGGDGLM